MKKVTKSVKTNEELWRELKSYCAGKGLDISDVVNDLIKKLLNKK